MKTSASNSEILSPAQLAAFIKNWDSHRLSIQLIDFPCLALGALEILLLLIARTFLSQPLKKLFIFLVIAGAMGFLSAVCWKWPLDQIPQPLLRLMPLRMINFAIFSCTAVILGLFVRSRHILGLILALAAALIFIWTATNAPSYLNQVIGCCALAAGLYMITEIFLIRGHNINSVLVLVLRYLLAVIFIIQAIICFKKLLPSIKNYAIVYQDWRSDALFREIYKGKGFLLTDTDIGGIQRLSRRPVLFEIGALDGLSYFPNLVSKAIKGAQELYGVDILAENSSSDEYLKELQTWNKRDVTEWKRLAEKYGFTQVLTSDRILNLPQVMKNEQWILYKVPGMSPEEST